MILFVEKLSQSGAGEALFTIDQVRHLKAKRMAHEGINVTLSDGSRSARATLREAKKGMIASYTESTELPARTRALTLYVGAIKPDRMSWLIEKAVEIGVDKIVPLWTERTQRSYWTDSSYSHFYKVVLSACTQSLQLTPPLLMEPLAFNEALLRYERADQHYFGSLTPDSLPLHQISLNGSSRASIWIGPEGGWSTEEELLLKQYATPLLYPGPVLRTETACLVFSALLLSLRNNS